MGEEGNVSGMNNSWETLTDWPPPKNLQTYYLTALGDLAATPETTESSLSITCDPGNPVETRGGEMLPGVVTPGPADQSDLYGSDTIRTFRGTLLAAPVVIAGEVIINLPVSTTASDTDFMVKLIDVYPAGDGRQMLVCDNAVRLSHAVGSVTPEEVYQISVKLGDRAYVFETGHRIGIDIQSSNYPRFDVNPGNGERFLEEDGSNGVIQNNLVYFGPEKTTSLILPLYTP
jgi:putative CocE/NonD family hydrolase